MDKSLKIIQTIAKVLKIICQVLFILGIIGAAGGVLGVLSMGLVQILQMDEEILQYIGEFDVTLNMPTAYFGCVAGALACVGECVVIKLTQKYLENELKAGTPFTFDGAKELMKVGIISILVSLIGSALVGGVYGIFYLFNPTMAELNFEFGMDIGAGLSMIFLSVIFKYGAQVLTEKNTVGEQVQEEVQEEKEELPPSQEE